MRYHVVDGDNDVWVCEDCANKIIDNNDNAFIIDMEQDKDESGCYECGKTE